MVRVEEMDPAEVFEAEMMSRQKAMHEVTARGDSPVQQFYNNAVVFVTGGSGFLGKQLIEKIIRATKVSMVIILLRPKKGKSIQQRIKEMLEDPVFEMVREHKPNFEEKIKAVEGDVAELRLGLSDKDWNMIMEQTDIIFHMAATTRFDECLRVSTMINVRGTREALILGKACKKLKSFVHVSTAYSQARQDMINTEVLEDFYPSPVDAETLIKLVESVEDDRLNNITAGLIKNWPNTYSFGKAVAEDIVRTWCDELPLCIVRPAIVVCSKREPIPGWLDMSCVYGASGMILGPGLGLMHVLYVNGDVRIGILPVDYANNAIIAAGWKTVMRKAAGLTDIKIYTIIPTARNPPLFGDIINTTISKIKTKYASPIAVGLNFAWFTKSPVIFWIYTWVLHLIPAYIIDGICLIIGKPRRFVKLYQKIHKLSMALSYFALNDWGFVDKNTEALYESLSEADKEIFEFDVKRIDWLDLMTTWCLGLRKYVMKDNLKNTKYGLRKQLLFKILMAIITPIYIYMLYKVLCLPFVILSYIFYNVVSVNKC